MTFEQALMDEINRIRREFADRDYPQMDFRIEVRGPVHGDLKIEFTIDSNYETNPAHGNNIDAVMTEFFRRHAWQKRHNALALPYTTQSAFANLEDKS